MRKYDAITLLFKLRSLRVIMKSERHFIKSNLSGAFNNIHR